MHDQTDARGDYSSAVLLEQMGGDVALAQEVGGLFCDYSGQLLAEVKAAIAADAPALIAARAHSLKGSAGNIGAWHAADLAAALEQAAQTGDLATAAALVPALEAAVQQVAATLADWR